MYIGTSVACVSMADSLSVEQSHLSTQGNRSYSIGTHCIITNNVLLILQVRDVIFYAGKTYNGALRLVWPLKMVPSVARGHSGPKKSRAPPKPQGTYKM